jgi:hypothetical protein
MNHEELVKGIADLLRLRGYKTAGFRAVCIQRPDGSTHHETPVRFEGKGWPDLIALHKTSGRRLAIEVKVGHDTLKPEQKDWLELMDRCGFEAYCWNDKDWWDGTIERLI